jgi:hypothetical protein
VSEEQKARIEDGTWRIDERDLNYPLLISDVWLCWLTSAPNPINNRIDLITKRRLMPPEFYITCPKCGHRYNVHKMIYDEGEDFSMFCPMCTTRYPRKEGKIDAANFEIKK